MPPAGSGCTPAPVGKGSAMRFGERLHAAMAAHGPLCVGIDPHPPLLAAWGLPDSPQGVREFSRTVITALSGRVAAVKPQVAFFERHGSRGMAALEEVVDSCRSNDLLCIVDAKRGDIGSTMAGYSDAFLAEGGPFAGDALTVSPYLGVESLGETAAAARENDRGLFILALTSNPEGPQVQHATTRGGATVAAEVAAFAARQNRGADPLGDIGLVVGATIGTAAGDTGTDLAAVNGPLLAPGVGAQGGRVADLQATFGAALGQVLVNSSREILKEGPDPQAIVTAAAQLSTRLGSLHHDRP